MNVKLYKTLAAATAIGLATSAWVYADQNSTYLTQTGNYNSAQVNQTGTSGAQDNKAGSALQPIFQNGIDPNSHVTSNNTLTILQSGNRNSIGLQANTNSFKSGDGVYQFKNYTGTSSLASAKNTIDIQQISSDNQVGAISQYTATHSGQNILSITQSGYGSHLIGSVSQYRTQTTQNRARIVQNGTSNKLARVEQYVITFGGEPASVAYTANENTIDAEFEGHSHGWATSLTGFAAASGATSSAILQGRNTAASLGNKATLRVSGNNNEFGVSQYGHYNTIGTLQLGGQFNEVGLYQEGTGNQIALAAITGEYNNVGVRQFGNSNVGNVGVIGDHNDVGVSQTGHDNSANVHVQGNNNFLNASQNHNAGPNGHTLTVNIFGSDNNRGSLTGVAASAVSPLTTGISWGPGVGQVLQGGGGHTATINIGGLGSDSNSNRFATNQQGQNNTLTATVGGGHGNQFGVSQIGSGNVASLTQTGSSNAIGITQ